MGTDDAIVLKRERVASTVWLSAWILAAGWSAYALAQAWPYVQHPLQIVLLVAVPGALFCTFDLGFMQLLRRRIAGWRRFLARAALLVAGLALWGAICDGLDSVSMARFERAFAPLIGELHTRMPKPCPPAAGYRIAPELAAYLDETGAPRAPAELKRDAQRFVLSMHGGSIDIDGSTLFYDSAARKWHKVHNDMLEQNGELRALTEALAETCKLALR